MLDSMIIFKDNDGYYQKKVRSEIGESYLILDENRDIDELNQSERNIIKRQDDFKKYDNVCKQLNKFSSVYGWGVAIVSCGRWFFGIF